jgi:hypothetical protein
MAILARAIYRVHVILIKIPMTLFIEIEKSPKIYMEAQNSQNNLGQTEECWTYHNNCLPNRTSMVLAQKQTCGPVE